MKDLKIRCDFGFKFEFEFKPRMMKWLVFAALLIIVNGEPKDCNPKWWKNMLLYQIYPRSLKDSNGDGIGDIQGIISKMDHFSDLKVDALWLSPFYPSPLFDMGYDISDFTNVDPTYGTLKDFKDLVEAAHERGMKLIVDFVPNHTSDEHEWFKKSVKKIDPYTEYYVWRKGKVLPNGTVTYPNNWKSTYNGPAWVWVEERQEYYFYQFSKRQVELNYNSTHLRKEMENVLKFWLELGIDGFRMDAAPYYYEDQRFLDEPLSGLTDDPNAYNYTKKIYTRDQPETYEIVRSWRALLDEYSAKDGCPKVLIIEAYASEELTIKYYENGAHFPFNFGFIDKVNGRSSAKDVAEYIQNWMSKMPDGSTANWVSGNHDNHRLVARFGENRARIIMAMIFLLPGVAVVYNGDEIGMEDTLLSWEETKDNEACNAGKENYLSKTRDPGRTPFQWDNTTSAGFSTNPKTWLPVNSNYVTLNLANEIASKDSFYNLVKFLSKLKGTLASNENKVNVKILNDNVVAFSRHTRDDKIVHVLANFGNEEVNVPTKSVSSSETVSSNTITSYVVTSTSAISGNPLKTSESLRIPPATGMILTEGIVFA